MKTVNIHEARSTLSALIKLVMEGEKVIIARNNVPVVELKPLGSREEPRRPGLLRGKMKILEDWQKADDGYNESTSVI